MILLISLCSIFVLVSSDEPPLPPLNPEVDNSLLQWTSADEDGSTTHTVQYMFNTEKWRNVPACVQTSVNSCNVSSTMHMQEDGCVALRVRAVRGGLTSKPVVACSTRGDRCSPRVGLSASPGSLTVQLSRDHELAHAYADHAEYELRYHKQGESKLSYSGCLSSQLLSGLEEGQTYCVQVQFLLFQSPVGLPSCFQCQEIPTSRSKHFWIILVVVLTVVAVTVGSIMAYLMIFHRKKIKGWLWLRPEPTPEFLTAPLNDAPVFSPIEEKCSTVTAFILSDQDD